MPQSKQDDVRSQLKLIQQRLTSLAVVGDEQFFRTMVPGRQKIYGVKTPILNAIAKEFQSYSFELAEALWKAGALEEQVIAIKIMERKGRQDPARLLKLFSKFSQRISNWAVCDGLGMQFLRGIVKTHADEIFSMAEQFNKSADPWRRRLSLVMVECYTRDKAFHKKIKTLVKNLVEDEEYYVKKAIAWINRNLQKGK